MCIFCIHVDSGPHKIIDKIFVNTRYFVMKSNNYDNVDIAKAKVGEFHPFYSVNAKKILKEKWAFCNLV